MCSWVGSTVGKENWEPLSTQPLVSSSVVGMHVDLRFSVDERICILSSGFDSFKNSSDFFERRHNVLVMMDADLYVMIGQVVDEVALRLSSFSLKNEYIFKLVDSICKCIQAYVDALDKLCCQELHKDIAKVHGNRPNYLSTFGCSRAVYIQVILNLGNLSSN